MSFSNCLKPLTLVTATFLMATMISHAQETSISPKALRQSPLVNLENHQVKVSDFAGKLLFIQYSSPGDAGKGKKLLAALNNSSARLGKAGEDWQVLAIIDCDATLTPNYLIRAAARRKAARLEGSGITILLDEKGSFRRDLHLSPDQVHVMVVAPDQSERVIIAGDTANNKINHLMRTAMKLGGKTPVL